MQQISQYTTNLKEITKALEGKWERTTKNGTTWAINGNIVLLEGDKSLFPFSVIKWHQVGSLFLAILGSASDAPPDPEGKDLSWVIKKIEEITNRIDNMQLVKQIVTTGRVKVILNKEL